jgi:hypothetical protein
MITKAAAGENHSLALTSAGHIYAWGSNSFGQLGFPTKFKQTPASSRMSPKRIDTFKGDQYVMVEIAAGSSHSASISASGHVYTWGSNKKGQLGRKVSSIQIQDTDFIRPVSGQLVFDWMKRRCVGSIGFQDGLDRVQIVSRTDDMFQITAGQSDTIEYMYCRYRYRTILYFSSELGPSLYYLIVPKYCTSSVCIDARKIWMYFVLGRIQY